jgi:hypothetical protein
MKKISLTFLILFFSFTLLFSQQKDYPELTDLLRNKRDQENSIQRADYNIRITLWRTITDELFARLSAQRFISNDNKISERPAEINAANLRKWAIENGFSYQEKLVLEEHMIPDETSRTFTSNLQTSGFVNNTLEGIGSIFLYVQNLFRSKVSIIRDDLNENKGRLEDIGEYTPFIQELNTLKEKEKSQPYFITEFDKERMIMLQKNTHLLTESQKKISKWGTLTGKIIGIALLLIIAYYIIKFLGYIYTKFLK